ncbi:type IVB secretion system protein IcmW [Burkholderia multivorans]|uniref:type IVB secretion system protein IcmW n=2 Tax=Burkholderia multivorans TaxID=87883 RepID=UPI001588AAAD|nr:hypothetical protein [Burkholderia multivorans]MDR8877455.1 hypothetical protein [Burkholderia multivorans]MDR8883925.1 hypothetical protein [Burkholderia multivorans]MDR8890326.1 hypothetical protein [Burkholderia multivorans]MDR8909112.1 hypothetical protein [Burkholderia multivorans]MDR8914665.1 hypothetical protein [Burkholderia multivorans]
MKVNDAMLSLASESVREYWAASSPELGSLFERIERTEDWTLDSHPDIADRLQQLGLRLADPEMLGRLEGASKDDLIFFLVYISTSKAFRLVRWMDEARDGLGSRLLASLLDRDAAGVFCNVSDSLLAQTMVQRLLVIQNTPFFEQLLSPAMLGSIERAINSYGDEKRNHEA